MTTDRRPPTSYPFSIQGIRNQGLGIRTEDLGRLLARAGDPARLHPSTGFLEPGS